jgi:hypothetical protein
MTRSSILPGLAGALAFICIAATSAQSQLGFTEFALTDTTLNSDPSTDFWIASAAPADIDADGDLDLLVAGYYVIYYVSAEDRLILYRNDGPVNGTTWALTPIAVDAAGLSFTAADIAWGDYDSDGDPDAVVASNGATTLYRNNAGTLTRTSTVLPDYSEDSDFTTLDLRSLTWADYDNDGDLDILLPSIPSDFSYAPTEILRNDGAGTGNAWIFTDTSAPLPATSNAVSVWADMEGDGDLDLLLANVSPWGDNFMNTYRNDGGTFAEADTGLAHIRYGMADWGDVDADGDLDVVYAGNIDLPDGTGETVVRILFSNGAGGYTPVDIAHDFWEHPGELWLDFTAVTWADYDSDGDTDLLVSGEVLAQEIFGQAVVYANNGGGSFTPVDAFLPAPVSGNAGGAFTWFDVDSDGDLDYFVAGGYYVEGGNGLIEARTQLFRNDAPASNAAPSAPGSAIAAPSGSAVTLSWTPASDDATPTAALTYDIEIVPTGATPAVGRALPEPGNARANTAWTFDGLADGVYAWSIRAIDSAFNGGTAAHGTFTIGGTTGVHTAPATGLTLSGPYPNPFNKSAHFTVTMARGDHASVVVYDVRGHRVAVLHEGELAKGANLLSLDGANLASGVYFIRATSGGQSATRRITLVH